VLILAYYFPPEVGSGPHLPFELGESLVELGHEVTVVTSFPRYHVPEMPPRYRRRFWCREAMAGMTVLRVNAPNIHGKTPILRGIAQQLVPWMLALRALPCERPEIVFVVTPPLAMAHAARLVARRFGIPLVVNVQDLFPQNAVDLGLLRNRAAIRFFEALERGVYRTATAVTVMSDGNRDYVIGKGGNPETVFTVPNWVDTDLIRPGERMNEFRAANDLGSAFVVLFAGTMGWSQGLGTVVEAARQLAAEPDLLFLMVGDGVELEGLKRQAAGLPNVRFLPMQPKEVYPQVLAAADACLVTLRPEVATPVVPSKISTIMAAGRPILASLPLRGDAPRLITDAQGGLVAPAGDAVALASAVLRLMQRKELAKQMGRNGRSYCEKHLCRTVSVKRYVEIFQMLQSNSRGKRT
jgi:glycosyltransferase involved in cell wall biosynthesis